MKTLLKALAVVPALGLMGAAVAEDIYGNAFANQNLTLIDSATGVGSTVGDLGLANWNSMELVGPNFYGFRFIAGGNGLYTWTLASPTATLIGGNDDIRGLTWDGAMMWGIRNPAAGTDELVTVDLNTGVTTLVGSTGFSGVQALASNGSTWYAWDVSAGLLTVDPGTGVATDVNTQAPGNPNIQGLTFGSGGVLYGARGELYTIDTASGAITLIGSGGYADVRGLATGVVVPEPATVVTVLLGGAFLFLRRRTGR